MKAEANLVVHCGGWQATREQVKAVPVPPHTRTYYPTPHIELIDMIRDRIPSFGLEVVNERFALAKEGQRLFGVFGCNPKGGGDGATMPTDWQLAIGFRTAYDGSYPHGLCCGSRVFVCDNLSFNGEFESKRKHTRWARRDLPEVIHGLLGRAVDYQGEVAALVDNLKARDLSDIDADHLIMSAVRDRVVPGTMALRVDEEFRNPRHEEFKNRSAWSLYNAFTEVAKEGGEHTIFKRTLGLTHLFNRTLQTA